MCLTVATLLMNSIALNGVYFQVQMSNNYNVMSLMEKGPVRLDVLYIPNLPLNGGLKKSSKAVRKRAKKN